MEQLPRGLVCLTLEHVIDDVDVVEALLAQDQKYESCIPLALKDVFRLKRIPDAPVTLTILTILWSADIPAHSKLYSAAGEGLTSLVAHILAVSPELQEDTDTLSRALDEAAAGQHRYTMQLILSYIPNSAKQNALKYALRAATSGSTHRFKRTKCPDSFDTVRLLLNMRANANDWLALANVAGCGNVPVAELLIEYNANVDTFGGHILWQTIENGQVEMLKLLMRHGISARSITSIANQVIEREIAGSEEVGEAINTEILRNADRAKALVSQ